MILTTKDFISDAWKFGLFGSRVAAFMDCKRSLTTDCFRKAKWFLQSSKTKMLTQCTLGELLDVRTEVRVLLAGMCTMVWNALRWRKMDYIDWGERARIDNEALKIVRIPFSTGEDWLTVAASGLHTRVTTRWAALTGVTNLYKRRGRKDVIDEIARECIGGDNVYCGHTADEIIKNHGLTQI